MNAFVTLTINQNANFNQRFRFLSRDNITQCVHDASPVDLRGWSAKMQIRRYSGGPVILELTVDNGRLFIENAPDGVFGISLNASETALLVESTYSYDLFFTRPDNYVIKALYGPIIVNRAVTV